MKVFLCHLSLLKLSGYRLIIAGSTRLSQKRNSKVKNEEQRQHDEWVAERNRKSSKREATSRKRPVPQANKRAATAAANKKASG